MRTWFRVHARRLIAAGGGRMSELRRSDRGDVPGWVMVTLMSALLVAAIFTIAQTELSRILGDALGEVLP